VAAVGLGALVAAAQPDPAADRAPQAPPAVSRDQPRSMGSPDSAAVAAAPAPAATDVAWGQGPWPDVSTCGWPLLLPSSPTLGPLVDQGEGWRDTYAAEPAAAAVAALRADWSAAAAPPRLRQRVLSASVTQAHAAQMLSQASALNGSDQWLMPRLSDCDGGAMSLMGATAGWTGPQQAEVDVYWTLVGGGDMPVVQWMSTGYRAFYTPADRQWRVEPADPDVEVLASPPAAFTIPGPPRAPGAP